MAGETAVKTIPQVTGTVPAGNYAGAPAIQRPLFPPAIPQNPHMSINPWSAIHDDTYMSDAYTTAGPLGRHPEVNSVWLGTPTVPNALVAEMTFDSAGRIVAAVIVIDSVNHVGFVRMTLLDPASLATLATYDLPSEPITGPEFRPAGNYFYQDERDRVVVATPDSRIKVLSTPTPPSNSKRSGPIRGRDAR
ncbi:MAG: hypothetical protein ACOYEV_15550 [Candidatus Nanopelagicales bacterium]